MFLQTALDHVFGDDHIALVEVLVAPPVAHRAGTVHHSLHALAQAAGQLGITQVAWDELGAALDQVLDPFGAAAADPHVQALPRAKRAKRPPMKPLAPVTRIRI